MLNNLDLKKEEINFKDSGCRFSSSCLSCPIEICVYDNPSLVRNLEKKKVTKIWSKIDKMIEKL